MIEKALLYKILANNTGAEVSASGNPAIMSDTLKNNPMNEMKVFGWSKQERTTGAQLFDASRFDGIEQYGVSLTVEDGVIYAEGTPTQNAWITAKLTADEIKKVFKNGKITIKSEKVDNCNFTAGLYFEFIPTSFAADGSSIELTLPENIADGCIYYYVNLIKDTEMIGGCKIMLYQDGNGTWEPYTGGQPSPSPDYPQQIVSAGSDGKIGVEVRGKNLFELTGIRDNEYLRIEKIENNTIYARPTNMNAESPGTTNYSNGWVNFSEKIKVISGILYTISLSYKAVQKMMEIEKLDPARILVFKDGENIILNEEIKQEIGKYVDVEIPLLIPDGTDSIYFVITCNNCSVAIKNIQIEEGGYTSYEPYHEPQSLSISTPTGLPAIPVDTDGNYTDANGQQWIADYIDLKRGKYVQWVYEKEIGEANWGVYDRMNGFYLMTLPTIATGKSGISNQFKILKILGNEAGLILGINNSYIYSIQNPYYDETIGDKGLSNWKAHLTKHPLVVMTYLDEPIERDLTPSEIQAYQELTTYAGTTILENDAECYMEVSAGGGDSLRAKKLALILGE